MSVDQPFHIYREELSSHYHGLALWDPMPVENLHKQPIHVSIGDVGYLDNGAFMRIFNVTLPWDDPSNKLLGKPEKYKRIKLSYSDSVRDKEIREGEYYTPHVSKVDHVGANRHEDSMGQMYQCSAQHRGALLSLPHKGHRKDVIPMKVFEDYIRDNVDSWFRWSKKMKLPVERMEDLILVTGCTLVTSWAAAAFDRHVSVDSDATTISLEARKSDGGVTQYFWRNMRGNVEYHNSRFDPNVQEPLPQNQCIFIRGFRAKRNFFRTISMRAAAEPLPDDPDNRREDEIKVTRIPDSSDYRDLLVGILDYIIQKCNEDTSAAEDIIAIAHDDDLQLIKDVETLTADAIENYLHEKQMPLIVEHGSAILRNTPVSYYKTMKRIAPIDQPPSFLSPTMLPLRPPSPPSLRRPVPSTPPPGPDIPTSKRYPFFGRISKAKSQKDTFSGGQLPPQHALIVKAKSQKDTSSGGQLPSQPEFIVKENSQKDTFSGGQLPSQPELIVKEKSMKEAFLGSQLSSQPELIAKAKSQKDTYSGSGGQLPPQPALIVDALHPTLLVDGYISHSFGPESAERHLSHILKNNAISVSYLSGTEGGSFVVRTPNQDSVLDRRVLSIGTVIPQILWSPPPIADRRRHVQDSELQMPIFFMHTDGRLGLTLEATGSRCSTLLNSQRSAPLGHMSTTYIRIWWHGYRDFKRLVQLRDETPQHNPVTLSRFLRHVGRSVKIFLREAQVGPKNPFPQWHIGEGGIQPHEIVIIGVTQVSPGSWMPILQLARHIF